MAGIIEKFYHSFEQLDAEGMARCYHDDAKFHDPAFGNLHGEHVRNMWRMLCESQKNKDFKINLLEIKEEESSAKWEAFYTFSKTGRRVHNIINSKFIISDGKIVEQKDEFNLYRWARQALGMPGYIIGWTPFFQKKLQKQTNKMLAKFENKATPSSQSA